MENGDDRAIYGMDAFKSMCQMQYGLGPDDLKFKVDRKLEGAEMLEIGGMVWEVIHIPGHSMGGIALYEPAPENSHSRRCCLCRLLQSVVSIFTAPTRPN